MTKEQLRQYVAIRNEIRELDRRISELYRGGTESYVSDSVKGSSAEFPYTEHTIIIQGLSQAQTSRAIRLNKRRARLADELESIEAFIESVKDSKVRQLIECKYFQDMSWRAAAAKVYRHPCAEVAKMAVHRYLKSF